MNSFNSANLIAACVLLICAHALGMSETSNLTKALSRNDVIAMEKELSKGTSTGIRINRDEIKPIFSRNDFTRFQTVRLFLMYGGQTPNIKDWQELRKTAGWSSLEQIIIFCPLSLLDFQATLTSAEKPPLPEELAEALAMATGQGNTIAAYRLLAANADTGRALQILTGISKSSCFMWQHSVLAKKLEQKSSNDQNSKPRIFPITAVITNDINALFELLATLEFQPRELAKDSYESSRRLELIHQALSQCLIQLSMDDNALLTTMTNLLIRILYKTNIEDSKTIISALLHEALTLYTVPSNVVIWLIQAGAEVTSHDFSYRLAQGERAAYEARLQRTLELRVEPSPKKRAGQTAFPYMNWPLEVIS